MEVLVNVAQLVRGAEIWDSNTAARLQVAQLVCFEDPLEMTKSERAQLHIQFTHVHSSNGAQII